jgi:hypothetical protein
LKTFVFHWRTCRSTKAPPFPQQETISRNKGKTLFLVSTLLSSIDSLLFRRLANREVAYQNFNAAGRAVHGKIALYQRPVNLHARHSPVFVGRQRNKPFADGDLFPVRGENPIYGRAAMFAPF